MGEATTLSATAIVASENPFHRSGPLWSLEDVEIVRPLHDHELLVKMVATGICHTDIAATSLPAGQLNIHYPKIVGHEGAGYVQKVGPGVTAAKAGDPVLLSFSHCGKCDLCKTGRPSYCVEFAENIAGADDVYEDIGGPEQGQFYGQSSFSSLSIVKEASVVNVKGLIKNDTELKLFAPLGCGLQTGAGAVTILGQATAADVVVVTGLGGAGLGCVMAAKLAGCKMVIGVDKVASRLSLAKSLGATEVIVRDVSVDAESFAKDLVKMTKQERVSLVIDTTGDPSVMTAGMASLGKRGKYIQVGVPPADFNMTLSMSHFFQNSNILMGCIMGDAVPREFIPKMIRWYRDGKFPLEKLITFMPVKEFSKALAGVQSGELIKPVLVW